jgi:hypothetical protein
MSRTVSAIPQVKMIVVAAAMVAMTLLETPQAHAYPGDPLPGCIASWGTTLCDGPVRPDGTFKRCWWSSGYYEWTPVGGPGFMPPMANCEIVDLSQPWPLIPIGAPQQHIDR